jgi:hypothetical protein
MPEHDDFQRFDIVRAPPPERQWQDAAKEELAEGEQHGASDEVRFRCTFYASVLP